MFIWKLILQESTQQFMGFKGPLSNNLACRLLAIIGFVLFSYSAEAIPLNRIQNCVLVPTEWADGDSFLVQTPDGDEHTVRLYGADCIEWHVTDESDARRLREQRRYFGITQTGGNPQESIRIAKDYGAAAAKEVRDVLREPFTLYTAYSDARGDGKYKRIYGFVVTHDGADLSEHLVKQGLARAYGVTKETYDGRTRNEYRASLEDFELIAARSGKGVWSQTMWENLSSERLQQRLEDREISMATGNAALLDGQLLDPNVSARDELMRLPGIGETLANRIIEARPYETIEDLKRVNGIGDSTLMKIKEFLKISR